MRKSYQELMDRERPTPLPYSYKMFQGSIDAGF